MTDKNGRLYFEYGVMFERVYLDPTLKSAGSDSLKRTQKSR